MKNKLFNFFLLLFTFKIGSKSFKFSIESSFEQEATLSITN